MDEEFEDSREDETVNTQDDFMHRFLQWRLTKLPGEHKILNKRSFAGIKFDAFQVHSRIENYDKILADPNGVKELLTSWAEKCHKKPVFRGKVLQDMIKYVELLKSFNEDSQSRLDDANDADSIIKRALDTLNSQRESIKQFQTEEKTKHVIDPAINEAIKQLLEILEKACNDIKGQEVGKGDLDEDSKQSLRRTITWLGQNGVGKSFCINLLLLLSEKPHWQYGIDDEGWEAVVEENLAKANDDGYPTEDDEEDEKEEADAVYTLTRAELTKLKAEAGMCIIKPNKNDFEGGRNKTQSSFPTQEEIDLEKEYLSVVRQRASDYSAWRRLAASRGNHLPSYMLTSAGQMSVKSTTMHATSIRSGVHWHFKIKYKSLTELAKELRDYNFETCHRAYQNAMGNIAEKGWDKQRCLLHETMLNLLRAVHRNGHSLSPSSSFRTEQTSLGVDIDFEEEIQDPIARLFPKDGEEFPFDESIRKIAGLTLVFVGAGKDALKDRIYIRRMLHGVLFEGLFSNFAAPPGTVRPSSSAPKAGKDADAISPDRLIISEVVVYAPSILLEGRVQWQDAPGTNDTNPEKYMNLVDALETCDGLMIFRDREQDAQLLDIFNDHVVPRIWESTENARFGNFLLNEKQFTDVALALARNTITISTDMQKTRKDMMTPIFHAIMNYKQTDNPEKRAIVKKAVTQSLNAGTWHVFPLMYTSLVLDSDSRLTFDRVDAKEWNPANNPLLSNVPTRRKVANDALVATFGRNMIDAVLHIMQSETQAILTRVREGFSRIKTDLTLEDTERPKELATMVTMVKKQRDTKWRDALSKFQILNCSQCEASWQVSSAMLRTDAYMKEIRQRLEGIMNMMRQECNPDNAVDFLRHEKRYKVKTLFVNSLSLLDLDDLMAGYEESLRTVFTIFERGFMTFLLEFFTGEMKEMKASEEAKQWLNQHVTKFWSLKSESFLISKALEYYVLATGKDHSGTTISSVRDEFVQKLERSFKAIVGNLVKEVLVVRLNAEERKMYFSDKVPKADKIDFLCTMLRKNLNKLEAVLKDKLAEPIAGELEKRKVDVLRRLFGNKHCVSYLLMTSFFPYVTGFNAMKEKNLNVAAGLSHAIGFVKNRIRELLESDKLGEVDGFWFETWVKTKTILSDCYEVWNRTGDSKAWLPEGIETTEQFAKLFDRMIEGDQPISNNYLATTNIGATNFRVANSALGEPGDMLPATAIHPQGDSDMTIADADLESFKVHPFESSPSLKKNLPKQSVSYKDLELSYKTSKDSPLVYRVKVLEENPGESTCVCLFVGQSPFETKDLHQRLVSPYATQTGEYHGITSLVRTVGEVTGMKWFISRDVLNAKEVQSAWAKLVEAVFPVIDDVPMHAKARKGDALIKLFDLGNGTMVRACADVFESWFGYSLDEFLQNYSIPSGQDPNKYVAPMLIGVAEMFKTPVLVKVDSIEYRIEPIFRTGKARQAFLLSWDPKYGFSPRKASDRFSPSRTVSVSEEMETSKSKKRQRVVSS